MSDLGQLRFPIIKNTPFNDPRNFMGQEILDEYNEWSKLDSGNTHFLSRMDYFHNWRKYIEDFWEWRVNR